MPPRLQGVNEWTEIVHETDSAVPVSSKMVLEGCGRSVEMRKQNMMGSGPAAVRSDLRNFE